MNGELEIQIHYDKLKLIDIVTKALEVMQPRYDYLSCMVESVSTPRKTFLQKILRITPPPITCNLERVWVNDDKEEISDYCLIGNSIAPLKTIRDSITRECGSVSLSGYHENIVRLAIEYTNKAVD